MNDDTADLDRLFARLSGEGPHRNPDDHPAPEKLSAYLANELSPEEDNDLQEHLAQCTLCAELLLDLQRFLEPPSEDLPREGVVDFETTAGWRELRGRIGRLRIPEPGRLRRLISSVKAWRSVAALLVVGVVAFGSYALNLRRQSLAPEADPITIQLDPDGETRSGAERVDLEGRMRTIVLSLRLPAKGSDYPSLEAEIVGKSKAPLTVEPLHAYREAATLSLPRGSVEPGEVKITLWGVRDGRKEKVGTYSVVFRP